MALGESRAGERQDAFHDAHGNCVSLPNGDFYVSDGFVGTRVVKFSTDGTYLMEWGSRGRARASSTMYAIAADAKGAGLRGRSRKRPHPGVRPERQIPGRVARHEGPAVHRDLERSTPVGGRRVQPQDPHTPFDGHLLHHGAPSVKAPGYLRGPNFFHTDSEGNFYMAEVMGGRAQKFRPRKASIRSSSSARWRRLVRCR